MQVILGKNNYDTYKDIAAQAVEYADALVKELKKARIWSKFISFHPLYQRIRLSNLSFYRTKNVDAYKKMLMHIIAETKNGNMYGQWNDYGRLLDY